MMGSVHQRAGHRRQVVRRVGPQRAHGQAGGRAGAQAQRRRAAPLRAPPPRQARGGQTEALAGRAPRLARPRRRLVQSALTRIRRLSSAESLLLVQSKMNLI